MGDEKKLTLNVSYSLHDNVSVAGLSDVSLGINLNNAMNSFKFQRCTDT